MHIFSQWIYSFASFYFELHFAYVLYSQATHSTYAFIEQPAEKSSGTRHRSTTSSTSQV